MGFLGKVLAVVIQPILNWIYDKIASMIRDYQAKKAAEKEIKQKNEELRKALEAAESQKERESAAKGVIDKF